MAPLPWLLFIHQIPAKPDYLRVKIGRRLQRVGAIPVKPGVYALPDGEERREDFAWIAREVTDGGGEAYVVEARLVEGLEDSDLVERFRAARDEDLAPIIESLRAIATASGAPGDTAEIERLRRRIDEIAAIDFFGCTGAVEARGWLLRVDERRAPTQETPPRPVLRGRTWVTRAGIKVDRMASAWLIRRFIDPEASFRFVAARTHTPSEGELRFDMFEGEFGHEGDQCTFEVLLSRAGLEDPALRVLAEIVHDIDCKDERYRRPQTAGFSMTIDAIAAACPSDEQRLARASVWLDDLYALLSPPSGTPLA